MLDDTEKQKPVSSVFLDYGRDMDGLCEMTPVHLEGSMKGEEHATQTMSCIANPKNPKSKALCARHHLMCLYSCLPSANLQ